MSSVPMIPMGYYRHYKGDIYFVMCIGEHTESKEVLVTYVSLSSLPGHRVRHRPFSGPEGFTTPKQLPDGQVVERFVYLGQFLSEQHLHG